MVLDFPANLFAAGDNGIHSSGILEKVSSTGVTNNVAQRLLRQRASLFSLLPNAQLQPIYGTDAIGQGEAFASASECDLCWRVLATGKPSFENGSRGSILVVPVQEPLLAGYPGVLLLSRGVGEASFNSKDIEAATELARTIERALDRRSSAQSVCRVILVDSKLKPLLSACGLEPFDSQLRTNLLEDARTRLGKRARRAASRVRLRDQRGIARNFRVETRRKLPIGDGAVLAYTFVPAIDDWSQLDEAAFQNVPEVERLLPALKFMIAKYASLPGLTQIAAKAKLSPFHFHREFSTLLGISPKHLMLDCQIESAGRQLEQGDVDLVDIARSCGFAHQSHFTSRFKQATGLTPTAWRKAVRAAANDPKF